MAPIDEPYATPTLEVSKLEPGTHEYRCAAAMADAPVECFDKDSFPRARPLRSWVDHWHGYRGTIKTPAGSRHEVSLEPWREEDPDTTFIAIVVRYRDPRLVGTKGPRASQ